MPKLLILKMQRAQTGAETKTPPTDRRRGFLQRKHSTFLKIVKRNMLLLGYPFERIGKLLAGRGLLPISTRRVRGLSACRRRGTHLEFWDDRLSPFSAVSGGGGGSGDHAGAGNFLCAG